LSAAIAENNFTPPLVKPPPLPLAALGEKPTAAIDNLDRAERLGLRHSADEWMTYAT
jgi:hypothetical protein